MCIVTNRTSRLRGILGSMKVNNVEYFCPKETNVSNEFLEIAKDLADPNWGRLAA